MDEAAIAGAAQMLTACAGARPGDRLLVAWEPPAFGYYDPDGAACVAAAGARLGLDVAMIDVGFAPEEPVLTQALLDQAAAADITVFMARLGDQLRFSEMPAGKVFVVSYALGAAAFASPFAHAEYPAFVRLKAAVDTTLAGAGEVRITCPRGTDVRGRPQIDTGGAGDTTVRRFPQLVFSPVPARSFSGRVALPGFLTGTGSMYYQPFTVVFDGPVFARFADGRLTGFEGSAADVARADRHYDFVADRFGLDRDAVHSWHGGIHPGCAFSQPASQSFERWSGAAFGNPRIVHFHTCGTQPPGEISWNVVDADIIVDGVGLWECGAFRADRLADGAAVLRDHPGVAALFRAPARAIGLD